MNRFAKGKDSAKTTGTGKGSKPNYKLQVLARFEHTFSGALADAQDCDSDEEFFEQMRRTLAAFVEKEVGQSFRNGIVKGKAEAANR